MVMDNCQFVIGGGECSEYPEGELEYLVYFSMMTNAYIILLSSGFFYSKAIENALASSKAQLKISVKHFQFYHTQEKYYQNMRLRDCKNIHILRLCSLPLHFLG